MSIIQGNAHTSAGGGYQIERSLRFNPADSAYLNRTLGTSNRRTFTLSTWVKRSLLASNQCILGNINFAGGGSTNQQFFLGFNGSDQLDLLHYNNGTSNGLTSSAVYRDPSAWYHVVCAIDTTQATSSNRMKLYVNGSQITAFASSSYPTQNTDTFINANLATAIGVQVGTGIGNSYFLGGYMAEVYFVDGQALTPSSFGRTSTTTGVWEPLAYTGTYGTNGFYVNFSDNSNTTAATLGKDYSGNGNNWTPNNFSVTAGAGNDSLVDSPTAYGTDTGAGGSVRGNYCTLSPLDNGNSNILLTNGNLSVSSSTTWDRGVKATVGISSGKWYYEYTHGTVNAGTNPAADLGWTKYTSLVNSYSNGGGGSSDTYLVQGSNGNKNNGGTNTSYGSAFTTGDIEMCALDLDNGKMYWGKNGTWFASGDPAAGTNAAYTGLSGTFFPLWYWGLSPGTSGVLISNINFGQRAFAYTAPSGFKALCTTNLPTPTIGATSTTQANDYFDVTTYSGSASSQSITNSGSMQPDFVWIKCRNTTDSHNLTDAVRGTNKNLFSNTTDAEDTVARLTSFNSNGVTLAGGYGNTNNAGQTYVAWQWNAGGSNATNTSGTITSTVRANTTSGFSIVTFSIPSSGTSDTVGHGLGVAPSMVILKPRTAGTSWGVYHSGLTSAAYYLTLQTTNAQASSNSWWNSTAPTSSVFTIGATWYGTTNAVAYCFAPVAGYSAFGSYTGNGSTDGPFVYLGFRPRYIMQKRTDSTGTWELYDTARDTYNVMSADLAANLSDAETTLARFDSLSNGFKIRTTGAATNASGGTYIYACFAESPFKYALAR